MDFIFRFYKRPYYAFLSLLLVFSFASIASQKQSLDGSVSPPINVVMFINADKGFPFYESAKVFATSVAKAVNFDLEVVYIPRSERDRTRIVKYQRSYLDKINHKVDLVLSPFWLGAEEALLNLIKEKEILLFSYNSYLYEDNVEQVGLPREKYSGWIGHISPDDIKVGHDLTDYLLAQRKLLAHNSSIDALNIIGIAGLNNSAVSRQRVLGLNRGINGSVDASLLNVVSGKWNRNTTKKKTDVLMRRHPDVDIIWAASDIMAYGVIDSLTEAGLKDAEASSPLVGSVDWSPESMKLLEQGCLSVSFGGHFLEPGWALLMFSDYLNGKDFKENLSAIITSSMAPLDKHNASEIGEFLEAPQWNSSLILKRSKHHAEQINYNFDPLDLINEHIRLQKREK